MFLKNFEQKFFYYLNQRENIPANVKMGIFYWGLSENFYDEETLLILLSHSLYEAKKFEDVWEIWFRLIKKNPIKYLYFPFFINIIHYLNNREYLLKLSTYSKLLYTQIPPKVFISKLLESGLNPRAALGIFNKSIVGWVLTKKKQIPRIELWYIEEMPIDLQKVYSVSDFDLITIHAQIPTNLDFGLIRIIEKGGEEYPGSPLIIDSPNRVLHYFRTKEKSENEVLVILPVYKNFKVTSRCIESVLKSKEICKTNFELICISDGVEDKELYKYLQSLHFSGKIKLIKLDYNRGFISAINEALTFNGKRDVVILTSDTVVFGDWLDRLKKAAYQKTDIGIVCPLTNYGEFLSYPDKIENELEDFQFYENIDRLCKTIFNEKDVKRIPLGVGFCMYIKKEVFDKIGAFEGTLLYKGYGEDAEFCLRAKKSGFNTVLCPFVYIYHKGGQSFEPEEKSFFAYQNNQAIEKVYSNYREIYLNFLKNKPLSSLKRKLSIELLLPIDYFIVINVIDRLDPVLEFIKKRVLLEDKSLGIFVLSEDGYGTIKVFYPNKIPIEDISFELPKENKLVRKIFEKTKTSSIYLYSFYDIIVEYFENFKIKKNLILGHLTPDLKPMITASNLKKIFTTFKNVYVFSKSNIFKKTYPKNFHLFPLFNEKLLSDKVELIKLDNKIITFEKGKSFIVTAPCDFLAFKSFVEFVDKYPEVCFFVSRLDYWSGVNLRSNVFPLFKEILEDKDVQNNLNLEGIIIWEKDEEDLCNWKAYAQENNLKIYFYGVS